MHGQDAALGKQAVHALLPLARMRRATLCTSARLIIRTRITTGQILAI